MDSNDDKKDIVEAVSVPSIGAPDMTQKEVNVLKGYMDNGMPELSKATDELVFRMAELYMSGRSYHDISRLTGTKKALVLFIAHKHKWYQQRIEHIENLRYVLADRLQDIRLESASFLQDLIAFWHTQYRDGINKYMLTKDPEHIKDLDFKQLSVYFKSVEMLEKLTTIQPKGSSGPIVNVNIQDHGGTKIEQNGNNELSITSQGSGNIHAILKTLSDLKRAQENS